MKEINCDEEGRMLCACCKKPTPTLCLDEYNSHDNKSYFVCPICYIDVLLARIEELEAQKDYECECNKDYVKMQNKIDKIKEILYEEF